MAPGDEPLEDELAVRLVVAPVAGGVNHGEVELETIILN